MAHWRAESLLPTIVAGFARLSLRIEVLAFLIDLFAKIVYLRILGLQFGGQFVKDVFGN
jgi:hypothetical protein